MSHHSSTHARDRCIPVDQTAGAYRLINVRVNSGIFCIRDPHISWYVRMYVGCIVYVASVSTPHTVNSDIFCICEQAHEAILTIPSPGAKLRISVFFLVPGMCSLGWDSATVARSCWLVPIVGGTSATPISRSTKKNHSQADPAGET